MKKEIDAYNFGACCIPIVTVPMGFLFEKSACDQLRSYKQWCNSLYLSEKTGPVLIIGSVAALATLDSVKYSECDSLYELSFKSRKAYKNMQCNACSGFLFGVGCMQTCNCCKYDIQATCSKSK